MSALVYPFTDLLRFPNLKGSHSHGGYNLSEGELLFPSSFATHIPGGDAIVRTVFLHLATGKSAPWEH
jgi:hypothetical protein